MALAMPSRFACLKIEGEDVGNKPKSGPKGAKKAPAVDSKSNNGSVQQKKSSSAAKQQQKKKKAAGNGQQWEEWKQRDENLVEDYYEKDLESAILLSKLEFEKNASATKKQMQQQKNAGAIAGKSQGKKQQQKTMSLDEFLEGNKKKEEKESVAAGEEKGKETDFFERVEDEAKRVKEKDKKVEKRKEKEKDIEERISLAQCQQKLESQMKENKLLREQLVKSKEEIMSVKTRNKTLCNILGHGEMKDKAAVLMELERLGTVKDELTEEVSRLHQLLEQERSKVAALELQQQQKPEDGHRKNNSSNNKEKPRKK